MPPLPELPPEQKGTFSNEVPPWENLPRIDFSLEEAEACLSAFEAFRKTTDEEIRTEAWEKINFFLLKAQAQGILGFPKGLGQKKTTGLALRHLPPLKRKTLSGTFAILNFEQ